MTRLKGVVDGVVNGELCGWLVSQDDESRTGPVICHGGGKQIAFAAFTFREDVVAALGKDGVFGFAIPIPLLASLGQKITVTDRYGTVLDHGEEVALPPLPAAPQQRGPTRIFLHIPKTAGTSLRNTLLRTVPTGAYLLIYPGAMPGLSLRRALQIPLCQRDQLGWVYGHCAFGFHRFLTRPSRYITFVREPMARLRSNFNHHAAAGTEFDIHGVGVRPSVTLNEGLTEEFDNVMTRFLAGVSTEEVPIGRVGEDEVELALHNVREYFDFVGMQSQAAADATVLQDLASLPVTPLSVDNVTPAESRYDAEELAAVDWNAVTAHNHADRLLYQRLQQEHLVSRPLG